MEEPKGIGFFNIKSGETLYAKMEAQIQGFINSSDMGVNASRGQDMGWRLEPSWVKRVKDFRKNEPKMEALTSRNGGQRPTTTQILYAIYGEQLRAAAEIAEEESAPFEEQYLSDISNKPEPTPEGDKSGDTNIPTDTADGSTELSKPKVVSKK